MSAIMPSGPVKKLRIGDLLVEHQIITAEQLKEALAAQKVSGKKLGSVLVDNGYITEDQFLSFFARQLKIDYVDLRHFEVSPEVAKIIPEAQARRFRAIALESTLNDLLVGMSDPTDIHAYDEISRLARRPLRLALVRDADLLKTIDRIYRRTNELSGLATELDQQLSAKNAFEKTAELNADGATDAPVVKLLHTMFEDAVQINASDIHIEPDENEVRVRLRMDGVLHVQTTAERRIAGALLSRLKLMAGLDISEKRLPQDGRFNIRVRDKSIDVRLSTLPQQYGEAAVMRLLNQSNSIVRLEKLDLPEATLKAMRRLIHGPNGLILVTGPTGSGKTTTLYSILSELNEPAVKIITVEDPVEYRLPGINQVQVNAKIDLTFARALRAILRQDPDVVLIGEMRDQETMEIGTRAAMTGHLVLSTLHTNDATSTIMRLMDMGAQPYLIAACLRGILSQRLVRRVCSECAQPEPLSPAMRAVLEAEIGAEAHNVVFKRGRGCTNCNNSGYQGRIGVYEFLELSAELVELLHKGDLAGFASASPRQPGFQSLKKNAIDLAAQGLTSADEIVRVAFAMEG